VPGSAPLLGEAVQRFGCWAEPPLTRIGSLPGMAAAIRRFGCWDRTASDRERDCDGGWAVLPLCGRRARTFRPCSDGGLGCFALERSAVVDVSQKSLPRPSYADGPRLDRRLFLFKEICANDKYSKPPSGFFAFVQKDSRSQPRIRWHLHISCSQRFDSPGRISSRIVAINASAAFEM